MKLEIETNQTNKHNSSSHRMNWWDWKWKVESALVQPNILFSGFFLFSPSPKMEIDGLTIDDWLSSFICLFGLSPKPYLGRFLPFSKFCVLFVIKEPNRLSTFELTIFQIYLQDIANRFYFPHSKNRQLMNWRLFFFCLCVIKRKGREWWKIV
jgi:hypothetical protein